MTLDDARAHVAQAMIDAAANPDASHSDTAQKMDAMQAVLDDDDALREFMEEMGEPIDEDDKKKVTDHAESDDSHILAGPDGRKLDELLTQARKHGVQTLSDIMTGAMNRLLLSERPGDAKRLFDADELHRLAESLAAGNATADLLGRARVHERAERAGKTDFSETDIFTSFAEPPEPLQPKAAVAYFKSKIPTLNVDADKFDEDQRKKAFSLAVDVGQTLLDRVKDIIAGHLEGSDQGHGISQIQEILDKAGVTKTNDAYAENVFRTPMMDAYTHGSVSEFQEMPEMFPVWEYHGIADGRQRPAHNVHFAKYFRNVVKFADVRDSVKGSFDGYGCRCAPVPVDKYRWAELQKQGHRAEEF